MGFYINPSNSFTDSKAVDLIKQDEAVSIDLDEARKLVQDDSSPDGVVVVVRNPLFDAADWVFSIAELESFTNPKDYRPRTILKLAKHKIFSLLEKEPPTWVKEKLLPNEAVTDTDNSTE